AFIWSDLTNLNNGYGRQELVWLATRNQLHNHEVNTIDQWATGPGGYLDFQVCNWDSDPNTPNGCDDPPGGEDQALYFDAAPTTKIEETIAYDHALGSVYQYMWLPNRYNVDLNYTVYSTGLKGRLDEINLFNVALTGSEVMGVYNGSLRGLELKLDEPPGQHLFEDTSGNNFSTSCSGATCPDSGIPGRSNQSLRFDGVDDYLTTEAADTLGLTDSSFTAMAWVKLDSLSGDQSILGTDTLLAREGLHLVVRNGVPYMGFYGSGNDTAGSTTLETGTWYHLAFRYDKDTQEQAIFINGVQDVAATGRASFLGTDTVHVGKSRGGHYFDGLIDHVVIQRTALSAADIRAVMNEAPVLNLHLDEDFATTSFIDDTPLANHATCSTSSCPEAGAKGQMREAAVFDGGDRKLTVAADPAYNLSQFTMGVWVKPNNRRAQIQPLVGKRDMATNGGNVNYALLLHPDNTVRFLMQESNCSSYRQLNTTTALLDGQWNHVMATYDGQTMRLYINGSPDPITETQTNGACQTSQDITIGGGSYVATWSDFDGQMDEITVHGAALSAAEVRDIYDYQVSWYDLTYSLPVVIDNDAPTIALQLDRNFVSAGSGKIWLVSVSDVGSYVKTVFANLLHGTTNEITVLQQVGDAWLYPVPDLLPGVSYTLQLGALDAAGNYGQSPDYDFTVDGEAPTATVDAAQQTGVLPVTGSLTLNGQVSDNLSGVASGSVSVAMLDEDGESASGYQQATVSTTRSQKDWSVDYPFEQPPYGTYDVLVQASDDVGNTSETNAGTVRLDGIAPSGDVSLPTPQIKPNATAVTGTATDIPYPVADRYLTLHFEEASGSTGFVDSSGRFYNAACSTCPAAGQPGKYGLAANFDGVDDALEISANEPVSTTAELGLEDSSFTVMAWVNVDAITGSIQPILGSTANGDLQSLTLGLLEDGKPTMRFGGAGNEISGSDPLPTGQWVHLAFRYNKEGQEQAIFVNGVAVSAQSGKQSFVGESPAFVGRGADPGHFDGRIDELFVVGRALTADEIYDIANPLDTDVTEVLLRMRHQDDGDPGPDAGIWIDVTPSAHTANVDTWTYTPPATTRLGPTRIDLKVTDSSGLQRYLPSVWNGEVTDTPLAVTLASFDATNQPDGIRLTWETVSELDNLGFNLYRAEAEGGPWTQLNQSLIASPNPGGAAGNSYQWTDSSVTAGDRYWYRLEAVDLAGQPEVVGQISIVAGETQLTPRLYMPLIVR
ncbi:MAG: LamG domain-containing protein, partial [Caldilineae bacterium]|nr:LamG domain-containing protein [Caldilineae bacterium]